MVYRSPSTTACQLPYSLPVPQSLPTKPTSVRSHRQSPPPSLCRVSTRKIAPPFVPPRLPLPPTTTCSLPRLPTTFRDYLPPTSSPSLRLLQRKTRDTYPGLLLQRVTAQKA